MAALRNSRRNNPSTVPRPARIAVAVLTILCLLPITWAAAFPEPTDRRLCPPNREAPPRFAAEDEIQAPASSTTASVQILNPLPGGKVSDKYDGTDRRFHITAVAVGVPSDAILEAVVQRGLNSDTHLGPLCPIEGTRDTFEGFWDIPDTFPEGNADFVVNAFDRAGDGAQLIASDQVAIDLQHLAGGVAAANEDVRLLWPPNDGPVGFFRNKAGEWKASVQAIGAQLTPTGAQVSAPQVSYSTTPLGGDAAFRPCTVTSTKTTNRGSDAARIWDLTCKLGAGDRPSAVTAMAAVAQNGTHSSDVHRVHPLIQQPADMSVALEPVYPTTLGNTPYAEYPSGRRRVANAGCLGFVVTVRDQFGRPVSGANVDVELRGPGDEVFFGDPDDASAPGNASLTESAVQCTISPGAPHATQKQGRSIVPDGPDVKAIESISGTDDRGEWDFRIYSRAGGVSTISAWADDHPLQSETADNSADDDTRAESEAAGTIEAQWLDDPVELVLTPRDESASIGSCREYLLTLTSRDQALAGFNIDFHVTTLDPEFQLCQMGDTELRSPDSAHGENGAHVPDPPGTFPAICPSGCFHLEGNTDTEGEIRFGITTSIPGNMSIVAWADGEPGEDKDAQSSKPSTTILTRWVDDQLAGPRVRLLAPSAPFSQVSANSARIVVEVGAAYLVKKVAIDVTVPGAQDSEKVRLGYADRLGNSNFYELSWDLTRGLQQATDPTGVPDGMYKITATIEGFTSGDVGGIEVNRHSKVDGDVSDSKDRSEWALLNAPIDGGAVGFSSRATRLSGTASAGAQGVDLFYTTSTVSEDPVWKRCGHTPTKQVGAARTFSGVCRLSGTDRSGDVRGLGALPFKCDLELPGCSEPSPSALPATTVRPERRGSGGAGDAIGVVACEGLPCLVLGPGNWQAMRGSCIPFSVSVVREERVTEGAQVSVQFQGPGDRIRFCSPTDKIDDSWPGPEAASVDPFGPDTHAINGTTDELGVFNFGVLSNDSNFPGIFSVKETATSIVTAWLDDGDGVLEADHEDSVRSTVHWELPGRCTIVGTERGEEIFGTIGDDKICGLGGNDIIRGLEGDDVLLGGTGNDTLYGEEGRDLLFGDDGDDVLLGGAGVDALDGGEGRDRCSPGRGGASQESVNCEAASEVTGGKGRSRRPSRAI